MTAKRIFVSHNAYQLALLAALPLTFSLVPFIGCSKTEPSTETAPPEPEPKPKLMEAQPNPEEPTAAPAEVPTPAQADPAKIPPPATESDQLENGSQRSEKKMPAKPTNLKVLPKRWTTAQVEKYMRSEIKRGLGKGCRFCHDVQDFASDKNPHKVMARKMMKMTRDMNKQYFGGKKELNCYTCHKGNEEPK